MKVHAYKVTKNDKGVLPFEKALEAIWNLPQANRLGTLRQFGVRLESLALTGGVYEMEFSKPVYQDLGKLSGTAPTSAIPLGNDEDFGTFTAAVYDPNTEYLLLEYNHSGARVGYIRDYLSEFSSHAKGYDLNIKTKDRATIKSISNRDIPKMHLTIAPKKLTVADRARGQSLLTSILSVSDSMEGDTIQLTVSCRQLKGTDNRRAKLGLEQSNLEEFAEFADYMKTRNPSAFRLKFIAKDNKNVTEDVLNFLGMKLEYERFLNEAASGPRKYPLQDKLQIIHEARTAWKSLL
jgi:hypothetical protein